MSGDPGRRTRLPAGGCVWAFLGALFLVVVGLLLASVMVTGFFDRPEEPPKKDLGTASGAEVTRLKLQDAAADGTLGSEEIAGAAGAGRWHRVISDTEIRITVTYPDRPSAPGDCYRFVVPLPLDQDTRVALPPRGEGCEGTGEK
ncbi:hypothetical protein [Streptomyces sp. NBC_00572]|uniref:hypothetical protein n=1 Tax=Streptomyces sp. NBC_00572 TaxID=2903664 RepID=UPI002255C6E2|nr:hypothetical protein [Streptomyces sp. NBC_00572]MCX4984471.1 hypothetical protein [Streptomyces sp. NBC_00572]